MSNKTEDLIKNLESSLDRLQDHIKQLSAKPKQKRAKKMKKKTTYKYNSQTTNEVQLTSKKFLKKAKEFLIENAEIQENEILYVVKALKSANGEVMAYGAYYGTDMSPLDFLINSKSHSEKVFLAEAVSSEAIIGYLLNNKNTDSNYNVYVFKVLYKDFKLCKIESFYGGEDDLDFYIFDEYDEEFNHHGEVLKRFGRVNYAPSLSLFSCE